MEQVEQSLARSSSALECWNPLETADPAICRGWHEVVFLPTMAKVQEEASMYKVHVHCACDATATASTTMKVTPTPLQTPQVQWNAAEMTTNRSRLLR